MNWHQQEYGIPGVQKRTAGPGTGNDCATINMLHEMSGETEGVHRPAGGSCLGGTLACSVYRSIRQINGHGRE